MIMSFLRIVLTSGLCLSALVAPIAWAQSPTMAVGASSQLYRTLDGTYGELFPDGKAFDAAKPVLAIEIDRPGEDATRLLVPGTEDSRVETGAGLFHDPRHDTLVLLWQSSAPKGGATHLALAIYDGVEWSPTYVVEEDGAPAPISEPLIEVTHDAFDLDLEEEDPIRLDRRVIHVLWRTPGEDPAIKYAPLSIVEGRYVEWHPLVVLDDALLRAEEGAAEAAEEDSPDDAESPVRLTPDLAGTLGLRLAGDGRSVLVTFANADSHRIGTAAITPRPLEIDVLGDLVRDQIFSAADVYDPGRLGAFSDVIRAGIVIVGHRARLHPAHARYLADQVADWVLASEGSYGYDLEGLGNDARELAVDVSSEVAASSAVDPSDPGSEILRIDVSEFLDSLETPRPAQAFTIQMRSDRPAPPVGDGPATVLTSIDGRDLLVAWHDEEAGQLRWLESRHGATSAWSETFSLEVGESLPLEAAVRLLARKIR